MSDEIRIKSIELENYRQYYGKRKINFSDRNDGFTIIFGKNGDGKSNLLNAITWCLYHYEPHGVGGKSSDNKRLPVINTRYIKELGKEKLGKTRVKIWLEKGGTTYSISRVLEILKHELEFTELADGTKSMIVAKHATDRVPLGCEIVNPEKNFVIEKKGPGEPDFHDTKHESGPTALMEQILPKDLSRYFILDGEFLEEFWTDSSMVKKGIEQISQLHLLTSLKKHIEPMTIEPSIGSSDASMLSAKIRALVWKTESKDESGNEAFSEEIRWTSNEDDDEEYYHASGNPRIKDLDEDVEKMTARIDEIFDEMPQAGQTVLLVERQKSLAEEMKMLNEKKDQAEKKYIYNLITKSPYVFLKKPIEESVEIIEEKMDLGQLPIRHRRQFADDLLSKGRCVCGESLDNKDSDAKYRRKMLENLKETLTGKEDLDAAVDMKYDLRHNFIDRRGVFLQECFDIPRSELSRLEGELEQLHREDNEISAKLGASGHDKIEQLTRERKNLNEWIESKRRIIASEKAKLASDQDAIRDLRVALDRQATKDERYRKILYHIGIWRDILAQITKIYDELKDEIRISVQKDTWKRFKKLVAHPENFKSFHIESDYSVYLMDKHDANQIRDISAGQRLILTIAFTTALREPTGYRFPLIIDSPLGKIDSPNKYNIATRIPGYLPKEQLTMLVTDTEYVANLTPDKEDPDIPVSPFGLLLKENVKLKHFKIKKERSESNPNNGNSEILPADLVLDKAKKTWMVENV